MNLHGASGLALFLACLASACSSTGGMQIIKVPLPIGCPVQTPVRPAMPTEGLVIGGSLDRFAASAMAEIELREGYETELRIALKICISETNARIAN